jgi:hypothetical protein
VGTIGSISYKTVQGGYSGYSQEDEAAVIPLLGRDPTFLGPTEAIQTSGTSGEVATLDIYADTPSYRDSLLALRYTRVTHDDSGDADSDVDSGADVVRDVVVVAAKARAWIFADGWRWIVSLTLRTYEPDSGS